MSFLCINLFLAPHLSEQLEISIKRRELYELSEAVLLQFSLQLLFIVFPLIVKQYLIDKRLAQKVFHRPLDVFWVLSRGRIEP